MEALFNRISKVGLARLAEPPSEVRLFSYGINKTTKGEFVLTEDNARLIIKKYLDYGNDLNIDYNHGQLMSVDADSGISAGTYRLELRDDGLYATEINWTDKAYEYIINNEYIYYSPAFLTGGTDGNEIVEIINFALTNIPATKSMKKLMAANKFGIKEIKEVNMEIESVESVESVESIESLSENKDEVILPDVREEVLADQPEDLPQDVQDPEPEPSLSEIKSLLVEVLDMLKTQKTPEDKASLNVLSALDIKDEKSEKDELLSCAIKSKKILPSQKENLARLDVNSLKIALDSFSEIKLSTDLIPPQIKSDKDLLKDKIKRIMWK